MPSGPPRWMLQKVSQSADFSARLPAGRSGRCVGACVYKRKLTAVAGVQRRALLSLGTSSPVLCQQSKANSKCMVIGVYHVKRRAKCAKTIRYGFI